MRSIGTARACTTDRSALPRRFATDVATNHAVPRRARSNAGRTALRPGNVGNRVVPMRRFEAGHIDFAVQPPRKFLRISAFEKQLRRFLDIRGRLLDARAWLATSSSGQSATYTSPPFSTIAV